MSQTIEVDVWLRGTTHATTRVLGGVPFAAGAWGDGDVRHLLIEMLLAVQREQNPGTEASAVTLRGFSWIVSPDPDGGVLVHLEMQSGTASAGPFAIGGARLTDMIARVLQASAAGERVH